MPNRNFKTILLRAISTTEDGENEEEEEEEQDKEENDEKGEEEKSNTPDLKGGENSGQHLDHIFDHNFRSMPTHYREAGDLHFQKFFRSTNICCGVK